MFKIRLKSESETEKGKRKWTHPKAKNQRAFHHSKCPSCD
jgi:hypothetical protein